MRWKKRGGDQPGRLFIVSETSVEDCFSSRSRWKGLATTSTRVSVVWFCSSSYTLAYTSAIALRVSLKHGRN